MLIQRSIPITLEKSEDILKTVEEFNRYQKSISETCFNSGKTRSALALYKEVYKSQQSCLSAQMKCSALRLVASAYVSAKSNKKPAERANVLSRFIVLRGGAHLSTCAEDRSPNTVKPSPLGEGS